MESRDTEESGEEIALTIGIATLNEELTIGDALTAVLREIKGLNAEVIVVAGGTDGTLDVARGVAEVNDRVRILEDTIPRGKPAALNRIFRVARGRVVLLTDGDAILQPGSVRNLLTAFSDASVGAATGVVTGGSEERNTIEKVCDLTNSVMTQVRRREYSQNGTVSLGTGYLIALRREHLTSIPENMKSDDGFLSAYVRSRGVKMAFVEDALVEINFARTLSDYVKQKSRTRYGHMQVNAYFPNSPTRTPFDEFTQFARLMSIDEGRSYGRNVLVFSALLTGITWLVAFLGSMLPVFFKEHGWDRISTTKDRGATL